MRQAKPLSASQRPAMVFGAGAAVGILGGLVGLGGAEFRLPLLLGIFGFVALQAVILNKAMSLVVILAAIPARLLAVSPQSVFDNLGIVANLLAGSILGAWIGSSWAIRMATQTLYRTLAGLLLLIAATFAAEQLHVLPDLTLQPPISVAIGALAGFGIGVVAALMGVAGGELLIPAITMLYAVDVKLAGSLAILVSLPTMLVALARYSRDQSFAVLRGNRRFVLVMALGSILGVALGGALAAVIPATVIGAVVFLLLVLSAIAVWRHA